MTPRGIRPIVRASADELAAVPSRSDRTDALLTLEEAVQRHRVIAEYEARRVRDRERFHPENPAHYASTVGMPYEDENGVTRLACVGCHWCCPQAVPTSRKEPS